MNQADTYCKSFALLRIGKCYENLGNSELALQFFNKCVEEDALLDKGWIAITDYYIKAKNFKSAIIKTDENFKKSVGTKFNILKKNTKEVGNNFTDKVKKKIN